VVETRGGTLDNTVAYTYTLAGDRDTATYATPSGTTKWQYADYITLGDPASPSRAFQTLRQLDAATGAPTSEEFHYLYDSSGRLLEAAFAQTPQSGFTPSGSNPWYDASHPASSRARAHYSYDAGGRLLEVSHWWDTWQPGTSSYSSEAVLTNSNVYELAGSNRGLKTASGTSYRTAAGGAWTLLQSASYGYDEKLDYLTSETTGGATANWTYDAAGNRGDTVADNLNRPASIGGVSVTSDVLGNRLTKGSSISYGWDVLNRMTSYTSGSITTSYVYRADGMRVSKSDSTGSAVYRYDGQMAVQDVETTSTGTIVNDYALGARGIDAVSKTDSSGTSVGYPLYDGHGNRVATLTKSGGSFALGDLRSYDAWGNVRTGGSTGRPRGRYVANLGHVQDDESGLVYMRARYYEPGSGRFLSEDLAHEGSNWFAYCRNDPVGYTDRSGKSVDDLTWNSILLSALGWGLSAAASPIAFALFLTHASFMVAFFLSYDPSLYPSTVGHALVGGALLAAMAAAEVGQGSAFSWASNMSVGGHAVAAIAEHASFLSLFMSLESILESEDSY
jgi:RHS repeat-associated protein